MGAPLDFSNIYIIPTWGLVALGLSLVGTLLAGAIRFWVRKTPSWILGLAPLALAAAWAASTAPTTMVTLAVGLVSIGLALVQLTAGILGLTPEEVRREN
jgi:hypothetical protein